MTKQYRAEGHLDQQLAALREAGAQALTAVAINYGSGYPDLVPGNKCTLSYHNQRHGQETGDISEQLCAIAGLSLLDQNLAKTAGYAHDEEQLLGKGTNEERSARILGKRLRAHDGLFSERRLRKVRMAIKGTETILDKDYNLIGQMATEVEYPDRPTEIISLSVASADLGKLFTPIGSLLTQFFHQELERETAPPDELSIEAMIPHQRKQLILVNTYEHPLKIPEAQRLLTTHKSTVIDHTECTLDGMERGIITSQQQLTEINLQFMRAHQ